MLLLLLLLVQLTYNQVQPFQINYLISQYLHKLEHRGNSAQYRDCNYSWVTDWFYSYILHHMRCITRAEPTEILTALDHECMHVEKYIFSLHAKSPQHYSYHATVNMCLNPYHSRTTYICRGIMASNVVKRWFIKAIHYIRSHNNYMWLGLQISTM